MWQEKGCLNLQVPYFAVFIDYKKTSPLFGFSWYITKQIKEFSSFIPKSFSFSSLLLCGTWILHHVYSWHSCLWYLSQQGAQRFCQIKEICFLAACSARWHGLPGTRAALRCLFVVGLKLPSSHRYHMHKVSGHSQAPQVSLLCIKKELVQNAGSGFYRSFRARAEFCNSHQVLESPIKCLSLFSKLVTVVLSREDAQLLACLKILNHEEQDRKQVTQHVNVLSFPQKHLEQ